MRRALAERLAEDQLVVIIGQPVSVLRERKMPPLKRRCEPLPGVEGCWHYRPLHYPERLPGIGRIIRILNRIYLRRELNQLTPHDAKRAVCFDSPTQENLVGKLGEEISLYLAIDDRTMTVMGKPINGELRAERQLLSKVDLVICISETLAQRLQERSPSSEQPPILVLPNGYDERIFNPNLHWPEPIALQATSRPRILVTGHISERIDWNGIIGVSQLRPQWTWIFVGSADKGMQERILNAMGAHGFYHPPIPVKDVPAWIAHSDACAIPYRLNPFTQASHPLKAMEYLAMGKAVLSTRVASLERYDGVVEWVNEGDGESYANGLDHLANQLNNQELRELRRRAVAKDSLFVRVNQFKKIIFEKIFKETN